MKINIAGAGSGKTSKMADTIIERYQKAEEHRNIYCITFTNNAAARIQEKLEEHFSRIPENLKVSTIHSFLYQEFIKPYYYLLYGKHFTEISGMKLLDDPRYRRGKISALERKDTVHVSVFTERVKWIVSKKSTDKKREKEIRRAILHAFACYCDKIFIDEAQDIDEHFGEIIKAFEENGIDLELMGDPKQDLKGFASLQKLMKIYPDDISHINECYRCPQNQLDLSNTIIPEAEQQYSEKNYGEIRLLFESEIQIEILIKEQAYDLMYISQKNKRFSTGHHQHDAAYFERIQDEVKWLLSVAGGYEDAVLREQYGYYYTRRILMEYHRSGDARRALKEVMKLLGDNQAARIRAYGRILNSLPPADTDAENRIQVSSIDGIKGQEGKNCLFILTPDLAPYLFKENREGNKTKSRLYVALTRSLDKMTLLISKEVEAKYGRVYIIDYLRSFILYLPFIN